MSEKKPFNFDSLRLPIAMVLSLAIVVGYFFYEQKRGEKEAQNLRKLAAGQTNATPSPTGSSPVVPSPSVSEASKVQVKPVFTGGDKEKVLVLENDVLKIHFTSRGGVMVSNILKDPKHLKNRSVINFEEKALAGYESGALFLGSDPSVPGSPLPYQVSDSGSNFILFRTEVELNGQKLSLTKRYELKRYAVELSLQIDNASGNAKGISQGTFLILNGSSIGPEVKPDDKTQFDLLTLSYINDGDYNTSLQPGFFGGVSSKFTTSSGSPYEKIASPVEWIALHNRFFFKGLKPSERKYFPVFSLIGNKDNPHSVSAYEVPYQIAEGKPSLHRFTYYYMPKDRTLLNKYYDETGTQFFQVFDQWDITRIIATPFYHLMLWIYKFLPSFGVAILLVTLMLKLATWPLSQKSLVSMQKMQQLSPKMEEIRKKYKNDSKKVNAEMMALYKKEKINPASGCLPMLIPIPIFIAMYSLFRNMIELDQESFLWIKDLALPDTVYRFSFNIPLIGHNLNILPIIMTVTSYLQSFTTPQTATTESQRQQMMILKYGMPIMFLFILWNMPSALVLFWTLQNLFSWIQALVTKKPQLTTAVAKK